jgi:hypothetical protein
MPEVTSGANKLARQVADVLAIWATQLSTRLYLDLILPSESPWLQIHIL